MDRSATPPLTRRELTVLQLLADGETTIEAATALNISVHTVRSHLKTAVMKLDAHTRVHAVALCLSHGWIDPPAFGRAHDEHARVQRLSA